MTLMIQSWCPGDLCDPCVTGGYVDTPDITIIRADFTYSGGDLTGRYWNDTGAHGPQVFPTLPPPSGDPGLAYPPIAVSDHWNTILFYINWSPSVSLPGFPYCNQSLQTFSSPYSVPPPPGQTTYEYWWLSTSCSNAGIIPSRRIRIPDNWQGWTSSYPLALLLTLTYHGQMVSLPPNPMPGESSSGTNITFQSGTVFGIAYPPPTQIYAVKA